MRAPLASSPHGETWIEPVLSLQAQVMNAYGFITGSKLPAHGDIPWMEGIRKYSYTPH